MLQQLKISGMRSFSPNSEILIEFDEKLTLILGKNGAGKTTILECIKLACTGVFPPNSDNGKWFIFDAKLLQKNEIHASVSVTLQSQTLSSIKITRSYLLQRKGEKAELRKVENLITRLNDQGKEYEKSLRIGEMDHIVNTAMGLNSAILQYVCFCHQDESLWPFSDSATLKKVFDQIFSTEEFSKAQTTLRKFLKAKRNQLTSKRNELVWSMKMLNEDRGNKDRLKVLWAEVTELKKVLEGAKNEIIYVEGQYNSLKSVQSLWQSNEEKKKELKNVKDFLLSLEEYKDEIPEPAGSKDVVDIIKEKNNLINELKVTEENLKKCEEEGQELYKIIAQVNAECNMINEKMQKSSEEFEKTLEIVGNCKDIHKKALELNEEYEKVKSSRKNAKKEQQLFQNKHENALFTLDYSIKMSEKDLESTQNSLNKLKSINLINNREELDYLTEEISRISNFIEESEKIVQSYKEKSPKIKKLLEKAQFAEEITQENLENTYKSLKSLGISFDSSSNKLLNYSTKVFKLSKGSEGKTCIFYVKKYEFENKNPNILCQIQEIDEEIKSRTNDIREYKDKKLEYEQKRLEIANFIKNTEETLELMANKHGKIEMELKENMVIKNNIIKDYEEYIENTEKSLALLKAHKNSLKVQKNTFQKLSGLISSLKSSENSLSESSTKLQTLKFRQSTLEKNQSSLSVLKTSHQKTLSSLESQLESIKNYQNTLKSHTLYKQYKQQYQNLQSEILNSPAPCDFSPTKCENLNENITKLRIKCGKTEETLQHKKSEIQFLEKKSPNSEEKAIQLYSEIEILEKCVKEQEILQKVLEKSIIAYHQQKIFQINEIIRQIWTETYKGDDIETIFISADPEKTDKRTSFSYKICFKSRNSEIDMRGRCSSGQRMMASLVVRIALAQAFSCGFSVIALDEPTTNMDSSNSEGLAECIAHLAEKHEKLQLIIISHDQDFLKKIIRDSPRESYLTVNKFKNCSYIAKIKVS
ncbi:hypothetical protein SteCoe_18411 [Stentor coeruleus]|uniref:Rad50/SbcC-type AAA domain-containing protein n=1 Tax=Stentor coeruleus TaxID=5963 RepID=A0A1R2BX58_9CILI|nr:hypothetical protein SteCoe_18411 [Stentor coeruleus]